MTRHIQAAELPDDIARTAEVQVAAGRFASVEDVIRAGVEAIATIEQKRAAVRAALQEASSAASSKATPLPASAPNSAYLDSRPLWRTGLLFAAAAPHVF